MADRSVIYCSNCFRRLSIYGALATPFSVIMAVTRSALRQSVVADTDARRVERPTGYLARVAFYGYLVAGRAIPSTVERCGNVERYAVTFCQTATIYVLILFATSPFAAMRSLPTTTACTPFS